MGISKILLEDFFKKLVEEIEVPESLYEKAKNHYNAVATYLTSEESKLRIQQDGIYTQGSFRLGTVIKPILTDEYDIDLVCVIDENNSKVTQQQLKQKIGNHLRKSKRYKRILDREGRRCWTLRYSESEKFHLDILPAILDENRRRFEHLRKAHKVTSSLLEKSILITDNKRMPQYQQITKDWLYSNPKGYSQWFFERADESQKRRKLLARKRNVEIESVPYFQIKSPLQKVIQILKYHRDINFLNDLKKEDKPISIIITTLSARFYRGEDSLLEALISIINSMVNFFENKSKDVEISIINPVNPEENFADKWVEHPIRREKFEKWVFKLNMEIKEALNSNSLEEVAKTFGTSFDSNTVNLALSKVTKLNSPSNKQHDSDSYVIAPNEQFIEDLYPLKLKPGFKFSIECEVEQDGWRKDLLRKIPFLGKDKKLKFFIVKCDIPEPFELKWKIRNFGDEAERRNDLRGQIERDSGYRIKKENTRYRGEHWLDCYVIKDGYCISWDRIKVPISI